MSEWQIGDLAVCVDDVPLTSCGWGNLSIGHIGRVQAVGRYSSGLSLLIDGVRSDHPTGQYRAEHFRKIRPDEHEACETEFVTLLKRSKQQVTA